MSKRSTVEPRWLDTMLFRWGVNSLRRESNALGYPRICPMLAEGIPTRAESREPMGYSEDDYTDLQTAIDQLDRKHHLVLVRCYRPWRGKEIEAELRQNYQVGERTWLRWLHEAAARLVVLMRKDSLGYKNGTTGMPT